MEVLLWTVQALLAAVFVVTGATKLTQPRIKMAAGAMGWAAEVSDQQFRAVGLLEILGAGGLILPAALNIAPLLTGLAAACLSVMMAVAALTHLRLHEAGRALVPTALLLLTLFVAVVRLGTQGI